MVHINDVERYLNEVGNYGVRVNTNWFISPKSKSEITGAINHSCDPNIELSKDLEFETIKAVTANSELSADYSKTGLMAGFECNCGSPDCKKRISPDSWRETEKPTDLSIFLQKNTDELLKLKSLGKMEDYIY